MNGRKEEKLNVKFKMKYSKIWMSMGINSSSLEQSMASLHQTGVNLLRNVKLYFVPKKSIATTD